VAELTALNDEERQAVARIHHTNRLRTAEIDADSTLSDEGRAEARKQSEDARQRDLDTIYEGARVRTEREGSRAYREAFVLPAGSPGSMTLAARDAAERVRDIRPAEADRLLTEAILRGDQTMVAAIGERAWHAAGPTDVGSHWGDVLAKFAASSPARQRAVGVMAGHRAEAMGTAAIQDRFLRNIRRPR